MSATPEQREAEAERGRAEAVALGFSAYVEEEQVYDRLAVLFDHEPMKPGASL